MAIPTNYFFTFKIVKIALKDAAKRRLSLSLAALAMVAASTAFSQSAAPDAKTEPAAAGTQQQSSPSASPDQSEDEAAKNAAQNPAAPAIALPFQNNTDYGVGPYRRAENVLLVEPVIPFKISENWAIVTRTLIPIVVVPRLSPTNGVDYGLGNIQPEFFLTSSHPGKVILAAGGQLWLPTATDHRELGINKWGGGPAFLAVVHPGHWLAGVLVNNQFAGLNHQHVNLLTLNPFVFYNMAHGWYFVTSPVITADWTISKGDRFAVPLGGGVGRIFKIGPQVMNARTQFQNDVRTPIGGPSWRLQVQVQFIFLQKKKG